MEAEPEAEYDPRVDPTRCIGCGLCPDMLPEVFTIPSHKGCAVAYDRDGWRPDRADQLELAAANCPVRAIVIDPDERVFPSGHAEVD